MAQSAGRTVDRVAPLARLFIAEGLAEGDLARGRALLIERRDGVDFPDRGQRRLQSMQPGRRNTVVVRDENPSHEETSVARPNERRSRLGGGRLDRQAKRFQQVALAD